MGMNARAAVSLENSFLTRCSRDYGSASTDHLPKYLPGGGFFFGEQMNYVTLPAVSVSQRFTFTAWINVRAFPDLDFSTTSWTGAPVFSLMNDDQAAYEACLDDMGWSFSYSAVERCDSRNPGRNSVEFRVGKAASKAAIVEVTMDGEDVVREAFAKFDDAWANKIGFFDDPTCTGTDDSFCHVAGAFGAPVLAPYGGAHNDVATNFRLFRNGISDVWSDFPSSTYPIDDANQITFTQGRLGASRRWASNEYFTGAIRSFRLYNYFLSAAQVQATMEPHEPPGWGVQPSPSPTASPTTKAPSRSPTHSPSALPTFGPSPWPTQVPSASPSATPTLAPVTNSTGCEPTDDGFTFRVGEDCVFAAYIFVALLAVVFLGICAGCAYCCCRGDPSKADPAAIAPGPPESPLPRASRRKAGGGGGGGGGVRPRSVRRMSRSSRNVRHQLSRESSSRRSLRGSGRKRWGAAVGGITSELAFVHTGHGHHQNDGHHGRKKWGAAVGGITSELAFVGHGHRRHDNDDDPDDGPPPPPPPPARTGSRRSRWRAAASGLRSELAFMHAGHHDGEEEEDAALGPPPAAVPRCHACNEACDPASTFCGFCGAQRARGTPSAALQVARGAVIGPAHGAAPGPAAVPRIHLENFHNVAPPLQPLSSRRSSLLVRQMRQEEEAAYSDLRRREDDERERMQRLVNERRSRPRASRRGRGNKKKKKPPRREATIPEQDEDGYMAI